VKLFEVNLLSEKDTVDAMKQTVAHYLTTEWKNTESYTQVKEEIKAEVMEDAKGRGSGNDIHNGE